MKAIPLTRGYSASVDDADYQEVSGFPWCVVISRGFVYAARAAVSSRGRKTMRYLHRDLMNAGRGQYVDHINHDTLDNRRSNLRIASPAQNARNRSKSGGCRSRYKGVCWNKWAKQWASYIYIGGIRKHLGYFSDEADAARKYNEEASRNFGEFALFNPV